MRHGNKINHLGRKYEHRSAMLSNLAISLIMHKRIRTTIAKAKELRKYVEPILNRGKEDTTHNRRIVFSELQNKEGVTELFNVIATKIASRNGGYTRILKLADNRVGDNAEMCLIELVDYNENMLKDSKAGDKKKTRRGKTTAAKQTTKTEAKTKEINTEEIKPEEIKPEEESTGGN